MSRFMKAFSIRRKAAGLSAGMLCLSLISAGPAFAGSTYTNSTSGGNAILVSGKTASYDGITVTKTGSSSSEDADFYGTNAAILAKNSATLTLTDSTVTTNGTHANAVFSYGSGTTVNVSDTTITTSGSNSGGIMTTGGGTMNATDLTVTTSGNSSAPIRSDRGGGDVNVSGGTYLAKGVGSPAIYSTADITVTGSKLTTTKSEAVVIEGGNSVTLKNATVVGDNTTKNGQALYLNNVLIYQSMSGDASSGNSTFTMTGGSMTSKSGPMFHVTNVTTTINLNDAELILDDDALLTASADSWGSSGSNGGHVTLNASAQELAGSITTDSSSSVALNLKSGSSYTGNINASGLKGTARVSVASGCTWTLNANSYISSLSNSGTIVTGSYSLYVNGTKYTGGVDTDTDDTDDTDDSEDTAPAKGSTLTKGKLTYKVLSAASSSSKGVVMVSGLTSKSIKSLVIPAQVKIDGYSYRVSCIAKKAFRGVSSLRTVTIKSRSITKIGAKAFYGIYKKAVIRVPKTVLSKYKKLIKASGITSGVRIKSY